MTDVTTDRYTGKICTTQHGHEIVWNGHLCEGANRTPLSDDNFCLWTQCSKHDVPSDQGHEGKIRDITCFACLAIWNDENGQLGVGA